MNRFVYTCRYTEICGFQGVFAGLLVGLKQIMPENDVTLVGYVKFRAKVNMASESKQQLFATAMQPDFSEQGQSLGFLCCVQHLPAIFIALTVTGALVLGTVLKTVPFVLFGTYASWFYLRFFQSKPETSLQ